VIALEENPQVVNQASADATADRAPTPEQPLSHRCPVCKTGRLIFIQALTAAAIACLPTPMVADSS